MARSPVDLPDIHPNVADIYRRKVARLADALNHPEDRHEAADALRGLIERIVLKPGPKPRQLDATLYGELGTIVEWVARVGKVGLKNTTITSVARVSASVNARARIGHFHGGIPPWAPAKAAWKPRSTTHGNGSVFERSLASRFSRIGKAEPAR